MVSRASQNFQNCENPWKCNYHTLTYAQIMLQFESEYDYQSSQESVCSTSEALTVHCASSPSHLGTKTFPMKSTCLKLLPHK